MEADAVAHAQGPSGRGRRIRAEPPGAPRAKLAGMHRILAAASPRLNNPTA